MKRSLLALVLASAFFAACADDRAAPYRSVDALVSALAEDGMTCDELTARTARPAQGAAALVVASESLVREYGSCSVGEDPVEIYIFSDRAHRDKWMTLGSRYRNSLVVGPQWAIGSASRATVHEIADALEGSLR
jgi:hypothetical protein